MRDEEYEEKNEDRVHKDEEADSSLVDDEEQSLLDLS